MKFNLNGSILFLKKTPQVLHDLLGNLCNEWVHSNEGTGTWSPFDVVGHLIICEITDFIPRTSIFLSDAPDKILPVVDMHAHFDRDRNKTMETLLNEFEVSRNESLQQLISFQLTETDLDKTAVHPKLGELTLRELLATWVVHDLNHIAQLTRIMACQYEHEVGSFKKILGILNTKRS